MIHFLLTGFLLNCLSTIMVGVMLLWAKYDGQDEIIEEFRNTPDIKLGLTISVLIPFLFYFACLAGTFMRKTFGLTTFLMAGTMALITSFGIWFYTL